jgi:hypothetical protein
LEPLAVLKRDVVGLNDIETNGVVEVDVVLGEVEVSQLRTLDDLSCISIGSEYRVFLRVEVHVSISSIVEDIAHPIIRGDKAEGVHSSNEKPATNEQRDERINAKLQSAKMRIAGI